MVENNDLEYDVVVIGSGAAGISAALKANQRGLSVLVLEKEQYLGGTTAVSGGWLWVPGNKQGIREGDTRAEDYIKTLAGDSHDGAAVQRFLDEVPESLEFFENETEVEFSYPAMAPVDRHRREAQHSDVDRHQGHRDPHRRHRRRHRCRRLGCAFGCGPGETGCRARCGRSLRRSNYDQV